MYNYTVLGNGSWSSALVKLLTENKHHVNWWMRSTNSIEHLKSNRHNPNYLSSVEFDMNQIDLFGDISKAVGAGDVILIGIPSAFIESVLGQLDKESLKDKIILSATKGLIPERHVLVNQYLENEFQVQPKNYCCITGPCHAEEVAAEKLSYLTFAGENQEITQNIAHAFQGEFLNTVVSKDVNGVQFASIMKNIYALGAGIAHGLDYGDNFLSVYITNCFKELQDFMNEIATEQQHHYNTSAYLGDLLVTCYSLYSRNRTFGKYIGKGYSVAAAKLELNMVAEGYYASKGIFGICKELNIDLPIAQTLYKILWEKKVASRAFKELEKSLF